MKMTSRVVISFFLLAVLSYAAWSQSYAVLEYFDDEFEVSLYEPTGDEIQFFSFGEELAPGSRIVTRQSSAELRLHPNGSIIRLAPESALEIEALDESRTVDMRLGGGRLRHVTPAGRDATYRVRSNTVTAGVRGTDYDMSDDSVAVFDGEVAVENHETGAVVRLSRGQLVDIADFAPLDMTPDEIERRKSEMEFTALDPARLGVSPDDDTAEADTEEEPDEEPAVETAEEDLEPVPPVDATAVSPDRAEVGFPDDEGIIGAGFGAVGQFMGMEVGSVTIDGETYSKLVFQPGFEVGRLRTRFYLPIVYGSSLFDFDDWYRPAGNDEWSFGTDEEFAGEENEPLLRAHDFARDLLLKIRYIEFGAQRDPFFFKIGNLSGLTLGHGSIVRDYANDTDFPAVRRIGLNLGIDRAGGGLELLANDLADPSLYGARLYARPFGNAFPIAFGVSGVADLSPASDLPDNDDGGAFVERSASARAVDPVITAFGSDIDLPIVDREALAIVMYSDLYVLLPYLRSAPSDQNGTGIAHGGFVFDAAFRDIEEPRLHNYTATAGVLGNIGSFDYRVEFQRYEGISRPGYFGPHYDRIRGRRSVELLDYLDNPDADIFTEPEMAVFGEGGVTVLGAIRFEAGYQWPFRRASGGGIAPADDDELKLTFSVEPDTLPLGLHGRVSYRRTNFVPTLLGRPGFEHASLFDANSVLSGTLAYPLAPTLSLVGTVTTTVARNPDGTVRYDDEGQPEWSPSVTIETRFGL